MNPPLISPAECPVRDFTDLVRRIPFLRWLDRWHEKELAPRVKLDVQFIDSPSLPLEIKFRRTRTKSRTSRGRLRRSERRAPAFFMESLLQ